MTPLKQDTLILLRKQYIVSLYQESDLDIRLVLLEFQRQREIRWYIFVNDMPYPFIWYDWSTGNQYPLTCRELWQPTITASKLQIWRFCVFFETVLPLWQTTFNAVLYTIGCSPYSCNQPRSGTATQHSRYKCIGNPSVFTTRSVTALLWIRTGWRAARGSYDLVTLMVPQCGVLIERFTAF